MAASRAVVPWPARAAHLIGGEPDPTTEGGVRRQAIPATVQLGDVQIDELDLSCRERTARERVREREVCTHAAGDCPIVAKSFGTEPNVCATAASSRVRA